MRKIKPIDDITNDGKVEFGEGYEFVGTAEEADAILMRSTDLHGYELPEGIRAIVACMDEHALQPVGNAFDFCYLDTTSYDESHQEDFCCIQIPVTLQM